jgi:hypothetical protein
MTKVHDTGEKRHKTPLEKEIYEEMTQKNKEAEEKNLHYLAGDIVTINPSKFIKKKIHGKTGMVIKRTIGHFYEVVVEGHVKSGLFHATELEIGIEKLENTK